MTRSLCQPSPVGLQTTDWISPRSWILCVRHRQNWRKRGRMWTSPVNQARPFSKRDTHSYWCIPSASCLLNMSMQFKASHQGNLYTNGYNFQICQLIFVTLEENVCGTSNCLCRWEERKTLQGIRNRYNVSS